ncbi:DUF72 domain-containing protein [Coriobacteriia bacterium Es71-Z0120]|uniref:DUF72 domain-containing protein n=1 Tax=Parvivirga hydrogeniphila TaxID=2939460 RepID=UPI002260B10B|nr:DUF72 domain-containing protein [Parvivirga hydrogeniphila]MCL4078308.1 DUF72 domain-containing protein [Parvivirga hydrogeniphila]
MSSTPLGRLLVGTSGWSYPHWTGVVYPRGLPPAQRLASYAERFATVEVNATFYRTPSERAVDAWRDATPPGFVFAVKGSRLVTHVRRLRDVAEPVSGFLERVARLGPKLEVVLWQLPPSLVRDDALLEAFLALLDCTPLRHAIEFRHESWLAEEVFSLLRRHDVAMVNVSSETLPARFVATASFVYARFHGLPLYRGAYDETALEPWGTYLARERESGRDCYVYFNNDAEGHAPRDALRLLRMLGG